MQTSSTAARIRAEAKPKTQLFSLKTPYMKQGRVTQLVAETPNLWIHTKINAEGGENEIHKHNTGDGNLVVIRVGAGKRGQQQPGQETRLGADGKPLHSSTPENLNLPPIEAGTFFAESAG